MLYNTLLFFLGIYSWNFKSIYLFEKILQKREINQEPLAPIKNGKKLIDLIENDSNSPNLNLYLNIINQKENTTRQRFLLILYNFYSFLIFTLLCIQPVYLFVNLFNSEFNTTETFITFLINLNTPINYLWAKYYFRTNHFNLYNKDCKYNCGSSVAIMLICVFISIIINLFNINSFYNHYYYINYFDKTSAIAIVIIEWIYARCTFAITSSAFTFVFCKHVKQIRKFIKSILINEFDMEDTHCLGNLIREISNLRYSVEISIRFFNKLLSFITVTGGISLGMFIRHKYLAFKEFSNESNESNQINQINEFNQNNFTINNLSSNSYSNSTSNLLNNDYENVFILFNDHDYYLIQTFSLYLFCQIIFFCNVIWYSELRNKLIKLIQSPSFVNRFLTRWTTTKIKRKCRDANEIKHIAKIILCIEEENSTTIDWLVLDKLTKNKWMDFSILGISTQDGSLIKKIAAFSGIVYLLIGYF